MSNPSPQELLCKQLLENARRYQEIHLPGYYNIPEEFRERWERVGISAATGTEGNHLVHYIAILRRAREQQRHT